MGTVVTNPGVGGGGNTFDEGIVVGGGITGDTLTLADGGHGIRILPADNEVHIDAAGTALVVRVFDDADYTGERIKMVLKINEDTSQLIADWEVSPTLFGPKHHWLGSTTDNNNARFNDDQQENAYFVIRGVVDDKLFYADVNNDRVGIGTNAPSEKLHVIGNFSFSDADDATKAMRFRTNGGDMDVEGAGKSIFWSVWTDPDFSGTQRNKMVMKADADVVEAIRTWEFKDAPFGATQIEINGTTGIIDFKGTMANSTKTPGTDAPADWLQIKIGGTDYYLPAYAA